MSVNTEAVRNLIRSVERGSANLPPDQQDALTRVKAEIDGWSVELREAGLPMTMIGALVLDNLLNNHHLDRITAMMMTMVVLK